MDLTNKYFVQGDSEIYILNQVNNVLFYVAYYFNHDNYSLGMMSEEDFKTYGYEPLYHSDWFQTLRMTDLDHLVGRSKYN
jgi:hypothetical protein